MTREDQRQPSAITVWQRAFRQDDYADLPPTAQRVLWGLTAYFNTNGECEVSAQTLATNIGIRSKYGVKTVYRALKTLVERGIITNQKMPGAPRITLARTGPGASDLADTQIGHLGVRQTDLTDEQRETNVSADKPQRAPMLPSLEHMGGETSPESEAGASEPKSPRKRKRRPPSKPTLNGRTHKALLDALVAAFHTPATKAEWSKFGKAAKELCEAEPPATPEDVARRKDEYERLHPDWDCTPLALASHWGGLRGETLKIG